MLINNDCLWRLSARRGMVPAASSSSGGKKSAHPSQLHSRTVNCSGAVGPEQVISGDAIRPGSRAAPAIAYSPTSQRFSCRLEVLPRTDCDAMKATLVDLNGDAVRSRGRPLLQDSAATLAWRGIPGTTTSASRSAEKRGRTAPWASRLSRSCRPTIRQHSVDDLQQHSWAGWSPLPTLISIVHTGRYVMTWYEITGAICTRELPRSTRPATFVASGIASGMLGSYDALSLAFNPVTGTFGFGRPRSPQRQCARAGTECPWISLQRREHVERCSQSSAVPTRSVYEGDFQHCARRHSIPPSASDSGRLAA